MPQRSNDAIRTCVINSDLNKASSRRALACNAQSARYQRAHGSRLRCRGTACFSAGSHPARTPPRRLSSPNQLRTQHEDMPGASMRIDAVHARLQRPSTDHQTNKPPPPLPWQTRMHCSLACMRCRLASTPSHCTALVYTRLLVHTLQGRRRPRSHVHNRPLCCECVWQQWVQLLHHKATACTSRKATQSHGIYLCSPPAAARASSPAAGMQTPSTAHNSLSGSDKTVRPELLCCGPRQAAVLPAATVSTTPPLRRCLQPRPPPHP